jgi:hypothetical protein
MKAEAWFGTASLLHQLSIYHDAKLSMHMSAVCSESAQEATNSEA